ncbi:MAG: glycosyltransferase family 4 protein, partial [Chloroflexi bacterium]
RGAFTPAAIEPRHGHRPQCPEPPLQLAADRRALEACRQQTSAHYFLGARPELGQPPLPFIDARGRALGPSAPAAPDHHHDLRFGPAAKRVLTGAPIGDRQVIPNGIDPAALLRRGPVASKLVADFGLDNTDIVLLAPVRITRRKNLEWAIEAAAAIRASGRSVQLLITGPPGPHNPRALEYVQDLKRLTERLGLAESVRFLYEQGSTPSSGYAVDAPTLSDLYMLSDVVTLPSESEGFGLPLAEAAVFRVPVVCTDLPAFREVAPEGATFVPLSDGPAAFAAAVLTAIDSPAARLRREVIHALSWDRIVSERLEPLLLSGT